MKALRVITRCLAALVYSSLLGYLVTGLFFVVCRRGLTPGGALGIGAILGLRVATLFASMTSMATLNWRAIWLGGLAGSAGIVAAWPPVIGDGDPPRVLLVPMLIGAAIVISCAPVIDSPRTPHLYHSSRFARFLHALQGCLLFAAALPASLFWAWTRPYVIAVTMSALLLWQVWDGACPVTLAENAARRHEGRAAMPPHSGFIPDVLAGAGIHVSGHAVTCVLYIVGFSLCGWLGLTLMQ